jgi:hypothetical protein
MELDPRSSRLTTILSEELLKFLDLDLLLALTMSWLRSGLMMEISSIPSQVILATFLLSALLNLEKLLRVEMTATLEYGNHWTAASSKLSACPRQSGLSKLTNSVISLSDLKIRLSARSPEMPNAPPLKKTSTYSRATVTPLPKNRLDMTSQPLKISIPKLRAKCRELKMEK